jgi:cell wall-associated NlpC family hydrolase
VRELSSSRRRRLSVDTSKIALSVGLCLCAGQLVATPASAATAVAPAAVSASATTATAVAAVKPKIAISANKRAIGWGSKVRVTSKLVNPRTGKVVKTGYVKLQAWRKGAWRTWQTKRVYSSGTVAFWSKPLVSGSYRAFYTGSAGLKSAASKNLRITVKASGAKVIREAARHKGARYVFGASGPRTFDCSGYTMYVYRKAAGKKLPHKANSQQRYGRAVSKSNKKVGDLIVFRSGSYGTHAAIYAGGGYMWAAPSTGKVVRKQKIYGSNYVVRRLI